MILPDNAIIVERDKVEVKSIIIGAETKLLDTGVIVHAADNIKEFEGKKAKFREAFKEEMKVDDKDYLYFRDWQHGVFYIV